MTDPTPKAGTRPVPPGRKLAFRPGAGIREAVVGSFAEVLAYASGQSARAQGNPAEAVHEYRKSIRRARALLRLTQPLLGDRAYRALVYVLRDALGRASGLRDADVLRATLERATAALPATAELAQAGAARVGAALDARLAALRGGSDAAAVLAGVAARFADLPAQFDAALPRRVGAGDLERGLARLFRRSSRALERARNDPADDAIHTWRKRVKELRYALEFFDAGRKAEDGPGEVRQLAARLAEGLGAVTDVIVLHRFVLERRARARAGHRRTADLTALGAELRRSIRGSFEELAAAAGALDEQPARARACLVVASVTGSDPEPPRSDPS